MTAGPDTRRRDRRPAIAVIVFIGVVLLAYRESVLGAVLGGLTEWTTGVTFATLGRMGIDASRDATVLYQPGGFAYEIYYRCTGFLPAGVLAAIILA